MFFFFNDTATTEIYTLSLHDALPIWTVGAPRPRRTERLFAEHRTVLEELMRRSEEHTSELQSQSNIVCRLLLEKKNLTSTMATNTASSPISRLTIIARFNVSCPSYDN